MFGVPPEVKRNIQEEHSNPVCLFHLEESSRDISACSGYNMISVSSFAIVRAAPAPLVPMAWWLKAERLFAPWRRDFGVQATVSRQKHVWFFFLNLYRQKYFNTLCDMYKHLKERKIYLHVAFVCLP